MRSSSGPQRWTSEAGINYALFQLVPLAPVLAGLPHGAFGSYRARTTSLASASPGKGAAHGAPNLLSHGLPSSSRIAEEGANSDAPDFVDTVSSAE